MVEERLARFEDGLFDARNRTRTRGETDPKVLSICGPNRDQGSRCQPTRARALRHLLAKCEFPAGSVFVNLGCGKGRVLLVASRVPFKRVTGVEYASELCAIARSNAQASGRRHPDAASIEVVEADAAAYEVRPDESVFYLFNPFRTEVVRQVVRNIAASVAQHSRPVWLVYNTPSWADPIETSGLFRRLRAYRYGWSEFSVYSSRRAE